MFKPGVRGYFIETNICYIQAFPNEFTQAYHNDKPSLQTAKTGVSELKRGANHADKIDYSRSVQEPMVP